MREERVGKAIPRIPSAGKLEEAKESAISVTAEKLWVVAVRPATVTVSL